MLLAAMLAMVLVVAAPATAQTTAIQFEGDDVFSSFEFANQSVVVDVSQTQFGDANASATDESSAEASAVNQIDLVSSQVLAFDNSVAGGSIF